ncbi:TonB-dependent receptor [Haemophilus influenzae biotype aegyptius]|uniref:TonB-dependent receptor domain-containing protein n=1 Tax=Haemophilus influenzae TaxID=727 RepID=UPI0001F3602B|nr:TonB-dependent receptor [Haemophilus influenzae]QEQ64680.1 TonB-dependent receptor plug domain-containing protein [Haemophilus influenzae biotype aegyptius]TMQ36456.1 TonB-dependent receptor [Haemophilus influenzae biotype aegyptius]TMQ38963.1 TonB-dependent receptor [Haemophilus influenzae biotype aegyptius]TMQ39529.1 TonB-dependent receptor [Haemophilus influenzae biotype aegyptius]TMQ42676.1 TonB-dependent receptor [Haemophilus influenzae biotype aegyptius]
MKKVIKLNLITLCLINTLSVSIVDAKAEETLDQIDVVEKNVANDKKPFTEAKAKSTRENVFKETQTIDQVIRSIPGAFTQQDKGSGVVSVNIRGENGLGRVNTMVDGVTQTFYSTALDSGQSGGSSQFGAAIDPNFIAGVDVNKSNFSGASGINALAGSANFRTLSVNDVITDDKPFGIILKGMTGSNATKSNFMTTAAGRKWLDNGGYVGVVYGYSQREVSQDYRIGGGERLASLGQDILEKEKEAYFRNAGYVLNSAGQWTPDLSKAHWSCNLKIPKYSGSQEHIVTKNEYTGETETRYTDENCNVHIKKDNEQQFQKYGNVYNDQKRKKILEQLVEKNEDPSKITELQKGNDGIEETDKSFERNKEQYSVAPIEPGSLQSRSRSHLLKFEYGDDRHTLGTQIRTLDNKIGSRKIENRNYQLNYNFNNNRYLDLNLMVAHNIGKTTYPKGGFFAGWQVADKLITKNVANIVDINNSYTFLLPKEIDLKTTLGFNYFINEYSKNRFPEELSLFYNDDSHDQGLYSQSQRGRYSGTKGLLPQRSVILQPSGKQKFKTVYFDTALSKGIYHLNYSVNFTHYAFNGQYVGYESTPTKINEPILHKSGHKKAFNHSATLSAELSDYFMPFFTYSRTHRMPNIQEMFFSQVSDVGVNTALKPEQSDTYQLGFNTYKKGLFTQDDVLGVKLVGYRSFIKNYIHNVYGVWWRDGVVPDWAESNGFRFTIAHQNYKPIVKKSGVELEINYDMGRFFANVSYAYQRTNQPTNYADASPRPNNASKEDILKQGYGLSRVSMLPKDYGRLELGTRWFDQKLTLGMAARYYGKSKRATIEEEYINGSHFEKNAAHNRTYYAVKKTEDIKKQPIILDLHVSYEPIKDLIIKAEVQNLLDKRYVDPLDSGNDAASQRYYSSLNDSVCSKNNTCEDGGKDKSVLYNFARGRTYILSLNYKF